MNNFLAFLRRVTSFTDFLDRFLRSIYDSSASSHHSQKVAESMLRFFPGFDAFALTSPIFHPGILQYINDNKRRLNPEFLRGLEELKRLLGNILTSKKSFNDEELVTGVSKYIYLKTLKVALPIGHWACGHTKLTVMIN